VTTRQIAWSDDPTNPTTKPEKRETEEITVEKRSAALLGHISEGKPLVLLQVN
jgi:hypothetical protein